MSQIVVIEQNIYTIVSNPEVIRQTELYQKVRDEINSRFNPLSGGTDWQVVNENCEALAAKQGLDLVLCCYLTVAKLKLEGVRGYANGLELINQCLTLQPEPDAKLAKRQKELLDWVNAKVLPELKGMKPTHEHLRDLYRIERLCERIHYWLVSRQPQHEVDFEGVGFAIFEHIDHIETQYHTVMKKHEKHHDQLIGYVPKERFWRGLFLSSLLSVAVVAFGWWSYVNVIEPSRPQYKSLTESPVLNANNIAEFLELNPPESLREYQGDIIGLYERTIDENVLASIEQPYLEVLDKVAVLQRLFSESSQVSSISQSVKNEQKLALEQVGLFVERFAEVRTNMANIALLVKNRRWSEVTVVTQSLEEFAVSLSPIYARVGYIESLIEAKEYRQAQTELEELTRRLNQLSWKIAQLNQQLAN